jgi:ABC-2 type transport system permease protein
VTPLIAQLRAEIRLLSRNGEQLLLTVVIPVLLLVFFSLVDVLPTGTEDPVDFLTPGVLALAVMSSAMVSPGIATGFERSYKVLKRLGATPLGRPRWLVAKTLSVVVVEIAQLTILLGVAAALGWRPDGVRWAGAVGAVVLATAAFAGIGLGIAGRLRAEINLAAQNGLYLVLLLLGGMVIPLAELPGPLADAAGFLPSAALADVLRESLAGTGVDPTRSWIVLAVWAVAAPAAAARTFRWE